MMKKVTMFVMAMALVVPALGLVNDNPPAWAGGSNTGTAVWDFSEYDEMPIDDWGANVEPTCLDAPCSRFTPIFEGEFDAEAGALSSSIWYSVQVPDVEGDYITVRLQVHLAEGSEGPEFLERKFAGACPEEVDGAYCIQIDNVEEGLEPVDGVVIHETTIDRSSGDECDVIQAAGGYIPGGGGRFYTAIVVDVIVHDGEAPPEDGPRVTSCFADPTIAVDPNEVAEEGTTTAGLPVSLGYAPDGDVTITVYSPDPNYPAQPNENFKFIGANKLNDYTGQITLSASNMSGAFQVQAVDDSDIEGDVTYPLTLVATSTGSDPNFVTDGGSAIVIAGSVTVLDNDTRHVLVDPDFVEGLSENNDPNTWICVDVTLSHLPTADVNVNVEFFEWAVDVGMVKTDVDLEDPNALQFNTGNWSSPQQICFAAIDNGFLAEVGVAELLAVCELIPSSEDTAYDAEASPIWPGAAIEMLVEEKACGGRGFDFRDINEDCYVTVDDLAIFVQSWLNCTDAQVEGCIE